MLTQQNIRVLRAMDALARETGGYPPTVRELGQRLLISSPSSIQHHIDVLVKNGLVARRGNRRIITDLGRSVLERGRVAA